MVLLVPAAGTQPGGHPLGGWGCAAEGSAGALYAGLYRKRKTLLLFERESV